MPEAVMQAWKPLPFEEAVRFFRDKQILTPRQARDLSEMARARAFSVAGIAKSDVLKDFCNAIEKAIAEGLTVQDFKRAVREHLERKGWLGRGRAWRVNTIFRTNVQTAYNVGKYMQFQAGKDDMPYWQYDAVGDARTRPTHAALDGKVFRADDPFWDTWYPPNGFNCRCTVRAMSKEEVAARGLQVERGEDVLDMPVEVGPGRLARLVPDPGFAVNPGKAYLEGL